jgi:predicted pyridoxine 5'-phosphate oxidase superfamily flavin-nucleotide-binding protein
MLATRPIDGQFVKRMETADMSRLYGEEHRALQDAFGTRKMADRVEELVCRTEFDDEARGFIESMDMFFLSTVDPRGWPTVSYKGGDPGFVKIVDETTLVFPRYDGNGMFLSMGNIAGQAQIGMLFISFERPHRLRLQGTATISRDDPMLSQYKEADVIVRVKLSALWQNCPRYIHRFEKIAPSRYVPRAACETPVAGWKRIDLMQDALSETDAAKVRAEGALGIAEWMGKVKSGDPSA